MLNQQNVNIYNYRKKIIIAIFLITAVIYLARLFQIQLLDHSYKASASSNITRHITNFPTRGLIYDRNGELLVYNEPYYDLMVVPGQIKNIDTTEFCNYLGIDKASFATRVAQAREFAHHLPSVFEKQITNEDYAVLKEKLYKFPGFFVQPRTLRRYSKPIAAHTFGYVAEVGPEITKNDPYYKARDYIGISGIEKSYETILRGEKGVDIILVDAMGRDMGSFQKGNYDKPTVSGTDIFLTIDASLQEYGEILMKNKRGSIVAIEPSTGEILAIVTSPSYDPNLLVGRARSANFRKLQNDTLRPLFNRALMAQYPPGSAFKIVNTLIGLHEGVLNNHTRFSCPGYYRAGNITVNCRYHPNPVDVISSIQYSCNTASSIIFRNTIDNVKYSSIQESFNNWRNHVLSFGFGRIFNSDLPYELPGLVVSSEYYDRIYGTRGWRSLTIVSLGIGQGELGTTPIQLANLGAIIANKGFYYKPHIVKAIENIDNLNTKYSDVYYTTVDSAHFETMTAAMWQVTKEGTARFARIDGIEIAGKTGTVQNPHGENHSVFIAFAPVENPKIAISVVVENAGYGSTWAAPIASLMIEKYLTGEVKRAWYEKRILDAYFLKPFPQER
jgi:penicillin-binding protein 2